MTTREHTDSLNTPILVGQPIAFTHSYLKGVKIGVVVKLTKERVKIRYRYVWRDKDGTNHKGEYDTLIQPQRTLILAAALAPAVTMYMLKMS
jgi:uncharacterized protein YcfL